MKGFLRNYGLIENDSVKIFVELDGKNLISNSSYDSDKNRIFGFSLDNKTIYVKYARLNDMPEFYTKEREIMNQLVKDGYEVESYTRMLNEKIKGILEKEMEKYVAENINMKLDDCLYVDFLSNYYQDEPKMIIKDKEISFDINSQYEAVPYSSDCYMNEELHKLLFDFSKMEFNMNDKEIFNNMIAERERLLCLFAEQYKENKLPNWIKKLVELRIWLFDKSSVNIVLKNGEIIKDELQRGSFRHKVELRGNKLFWNLSWKASKNMSEINFDDIDYLKYGKNEKIFIDSDFFVIDK